MDYSKLSDFEVNNLVATQQGYPIHGIGYVDGLDGDYPYVAENDSWSCTRYVLRDYCNNPADAWPIIVSSGISLRKLHNGKWRGINEWGVSHQQDDDKPLRAGMIVYLMMQESEG